MKKKHYSHSTDFFHSGGLNPSTGSRGQIDPRPYTLFNIEKWF